MRRGMLAIGLILAGPWIAAGTGWQPVTVGRPEPPSIDVIASDVGKTTLQFTLNGYGVHDESVGGTAHLSLTLPEGGRLFERGAPDLPVFAADVAVADEGTIRIAVSDVRRTKIEGVHIAPSKGSLSRTVDPDAIPFEFGEAYRLDAYYPDTICEIGEPFLLRDVRGVTLRIRPLRYNPVRRELEIITSFRVTLTVEGEGGKNVLAPGRRAGAGAFFESLYGRRFVNWRESETRYPAITETGRLVIIANDTFLGAMEPLLEWKLQKGIETTLTGLSAIGTSTSDVQAFIQSEYDRGGLAFVLLVGDAAEMPYPTGTAGNVSGQAADPRYALLAGDDSYPDIIVSRFPSQTAEEAETMVNRIIHYEKSPQPGAAWYHQGTGIASNEGSPTDYERAEWLRADLMGYTYTLIDQIYDPGATAAMVTGALNDGRGIVNYIGHGGETSWGTTWFSVGNVYGLENTDRVPFIFDVACVNGRFNRYGGDCFAEAWLKAGDPAAPKGALGIYASSTNQDWVPPCDAQAEMVDLLVAETYHTFGGLCIHGVMKGLDLYPGTTGNQLYQQWHIFGDGSSTVFTEAPVSMTALHDGVLPVGEGTYEVRVQGVADALCALYDPAERILYGSAFTGDDGAATLTLDPVPDEAMTLTLTVTAFNRLPLIDSMDIIIPEGPWLRYEDHLIDDSAGNGDGILNPGESAMMEVTLENIGVDPGTGISATLTSSSPHVSVTDPSASYPDIGVGQTAVSLSDHFSFNVSQEAQEGEIIPFSVEWEAAGGYQGRSSFGLPVCVPLQISDVAVLDVTGNSATVSWTTNVPATSTVLYGPAIPPQASAGDTLHTTDHRVLLEDLDVAQRYYFLVSSESPSCYAVQDDNGGQCYSFTTLTCAASAPAEGYTHQDVQFMASSSVSGGPVTYAWDFGDGSSASYQQYPTHAYGAPGTYVWMLTVSANDETCTAEGTIRITDTCTVVCTAQGQPEQGFAPLEVGFEADAETDHCDADPSFLWRFGDGQTSRLEDPIHVYADAGEYQWTLSVMSDDAVCTRQGTVRVAESPPCSVECEAACAPASGGVPLEVAFTGSAEAPHCSGEPVFFWEFGDGSFSLEQNPVHLYTEEGDHAWRLTVEVMGISCTREGHVVVAPSPCTVTCSAQATPETGQAPLQVAFLSEIETEGCPDPPTLLWEFGDGHTSQAGSPVHLYEAPGEYAWRFTVEVNGVTCVEAGTVFVTEPCVVECGADTNPTSGDAPLEVAYTSWFQASACDGPATYRWEFGDGSTASSASPGHTYAAPGTYPWSLEVEVDGTTCRREGIIEVSAPCSVTCSAMASPTGGAAPLTVTLEATAAFENCSGDAGYIWDFGDETGGSGQTTEHVYREAGTYLCELTVSTDGASCTGTVEITVDPGVPGDGDGDGVVSIGEVQMVVNMFLGGETPGNGADCDGDGAISLGEVQRVINAFLGFGGTC